VEPWLAEDGISKGGDVGLAQNLRHVLRVEDQVVPGAKCECKKWVPEGSEG